MHAIFNSICVLLCAPGYIYMYIYIYIYIYIYLFSLFEIQQTYLHTQTHTKYSEHKIVGLNINKHAAWHCRALNLIKSRLLHATG